MCVHSWETSSPKLLSVVASLSADHSSGAALKYPYLSASPRQLIVNRWYGKDQEKLPTNIYADCLDNV